MEEKDFDSKKFGDFFEEAVEVEPIEEINFQDASIGTYVPQVVNPPEPKSEEQVHSAIDELIKKYNLPMKNYSVKDVLENIDKIDTDDTSFDLVASKITQDYVGRVALRGVITEASLVNKVFELMDRTNINSIDGDTFLMIGKAFEYQEKLFNILDRYKRSGLSESLKHVADEQKTVIKEDRITLSPTEMKELLKKVREEYSKESSNEGS